MSSAYVNSQSSESRDRKADVGVRGLKGEKDSIPLLGETSRSLFGEWILRSLCFSGHSAVIWSTGRFYNLPATGETGRE